MNQLDALKQDTTVLADTGHFKRLAPFTPRDANANPDAMLEALA